MNRIRFLGIISTPSLCLSLSDVLLIYYCRVSLCHPLFHLFFPCPSHWLLHSDFFNCSDIYHFIFFPTVALAGSFYYIIFAISFDCLSLDFPFPKFFFLLLGLFFPFCYTISPSFMLPFYLHAQTTTVYLCSLELLLFCSAPVVRPYEMNWYKWHFMGPRSTTRLNTAGNHKSYCLLRMPLLMCSIWFNASDRWGENRRWGLGGGVERELRDKNGDKRDK